MIRFTEDYNIYARREAVQEIYTLVDELDKCVILDIPIEIDLIKKLIHKVRIADWDVIHFADEDIGENHYNIRTELIGLQNILNEDTSLSEKTKKDLQHIHDNIKIETEIL